MYIQPVLVKIAFRMRNAISWSLFHVIIRIHCGLDHVSYTFNRKRKHIKVYGNKPSTEYIGEVMKNICICNSVHSGVCGDGEEKDVGEDAEAGLNAGHHTTGADRFDKEDKGQYR
jgi:hypothetical protein